MKQFLIGLVVGAAIVLPVGVHAAPKHPKFANNQTVYVIDCGFDSCVWWPGVVIDNSTALQDQSYFVSYKAKGSTKSLDVYQDDLRNRPNGVCKL